MMISSSKSSINASLDKRRHAALCKELMGDHNYVLMTLGWAANKQQEANSVNQLVLSRFVNALCAVSR